MPGERILKWERVLAGISALIIVAACIIAAGCTTIPEKGADAGSGTADLLTNTTWLLDSYLGENATFVPALAGTEVTARFDDGGRIGGSAGCNSYGGEYRVQERDLTFSALFRTEMYCLDPEGVMEQEDRYLSLLGVVAYYRVNDTHLVLTDDNGNALLIYTQAPAPLQVPLTETCWVLTTYRSGADTVASVIAGTRITAEFTAAGNLTGTAGCNEYFATYQAEGATITIGPIGSTKMNCITPAGIMNQEQTYLGLLGDAAGFRIEGDRLELTDPEQKMLLLYTAG
jgi:heat shock protein HslJ